MQPEDQCCVMSPVLADAATGPLLDALILVAVEKQTPMSGPRPRDCYNNSASARSTSVDIAEAYRS